VCSVSHLHHNYSIYHVRQFPHFMVTIAYLLHCAFISWYFICSAKNPTKIPFYSASDLTPHILPYSASDPTYNIPLYSAIDLIDSIPLFSSKTSLIIDHIIPPGISCIIMNYILLGSSLFIIIRQESHS
jgi:hypothetical protein